MRNKRCVFCDQILDRFIVECETCSILYCKDCWFELEEKCLGCQTVYDDYLCANDDD